MGCKNYCLYGQNACCLECQIKDQCNIQCDDIDSYEYAVECQDYDGYGDGLDRAIEIVKRGGRDEE